MQKGGRKGANFLYLWRESTVSTGLQHGLEKHHSLGTAEGVCSTGCRRAQGDSATIDSCKLCVEAGRKSQGWGYCQACVSTCSSSVVWASASAFWARALTCLAYATAFGVSGHTVAVAHAMMCSIFHMLSRNEEYRELGANYFDERRQFTVHRFTRRIEHLGYRVHLEQVAAPTT
jgi:hypothetical protein